MTRAKNSILLSFIIGMLLWIYCGTAYAANYGVVQVTCNVESILELWVDGQSGGTAGSTINFSSATAWSTENVADWFSDVSYRCNVASWKLEAKNVSTDNATYVDGLMKWDDPTKVFPLYLYVMPIYDGIKNNPSLTDSGWNPVWDSQRANPTGDLWTILMGHSEVYDLTHKEIYYKADFTNSTAGNYYAVIQYQLSVQ